MLAIFPGQYVLRRHLSPKVPYFALFPNFSVSVSANVCRYFTKILISEMPAVPFIGRDPQFENTNIIRIGPGLLLEAVKGHAMCTISLVSSLEKLI